MSKVTMPEPVAWLHICRKKPESKALLYGSDSPQLAARGYKPHPLFNSDQLEAYAAAKVREALEEAKPDNIKRAEYYGEGYGDGWKAALELAAIREQLTKASSAINTLLPSTPA